MVELRASRREEVPRLKELWKLAFGDEDSYIDFFFERLYTPERMVLLAEDGVPMTMLALLPMTFSNRDGEPARMSYIYALYGNICFDQNFLGNFTGKFREFCTEIDQHAMIIRSV